MEFGHFRESIILRGAKRIDPDEELEKRMAQRRKDRNIGPENELKHGRDRKSDKGAGKVKGEGDDLETEERPRGAEAAVGRVPHNLEDLEPLTLSDMPGSNGERARPREEDHYGFLYSMSEADSHYDPVLPPEKAREREKKWRKMLDKWAVWIGPKKHKLKDRCRKGIPSSMRGIVWLYLCGANEMISQNKGLFDDLVSRPDPQDAMLIIDKDLDRTFPSHVLFAKAGSLGQQDLRKVLKAYALHDPRTGYCQAMAPVTATLLMHMTAEESFWCLVQICEQYLPGYYSPGLHSFQIDALILKDLLKKYLPGINQFMDSKSIDSPNEMTHKRGLDPILYCTEWYMSIFSRSLPWPTVLRVWDMFFFEGVKVLHKTALAIIFLTFQNKEDREGCKEFFHLTKRLRELSINVTHENNLIPAMLKFGITRRDLHIEHLAMADIYFSEERARQMALESRRRLNTRSTFSITSDASDV